MIRTTKMIGAICALALIALSLVACGGTGTGTKVSSSSDSPATQRADVQTAFQAVKDHYYFAEDATGLAHMDATAAAQIVANDEPQLVGKVSFGGSTGAVKITDGSTVGTIDGARRSISITP